MSKKYQPKPTPKQLEDFGNWVENFILDMRATKRELMNIDTSNKTNGVAENPDSGSDQGRIPQ